MNGWMDDAAIAQLHRALTRSSRQVSVIASNLANVDTPGYRARRMEFDDALRVAQRLQLERTDPRHVPPQAAAEPEGRMELAPVTRMRLDGNTVDVDQEMTTLARQRGRYGTAAQMVRRRFALLRYVITDGRI